MLPLAAAVEHPGSGAACVFQPGFGFALCALANQARFVIFQFQAQRTTEGHGWRENALALHATARTFRVCRSLINRAPDLVTFAAVAATEFVNRHVEGRKKGGWLKPTPRPFAKSIDSRPLHRSRQEMEGQCLTLAGCPGRRSLWEWPTLHRHWGYLQYR